MKLTKGQSSLHSLYTFQTVGKVLTTFLKYMLKEKGRAGKYFSLFSTMMIKPLFLICICSYYRSKGSSCGWVFLRTFMSDDSLLFPLKSFSWIVMLCFPLTCLFARQREIKYFNKLKVNWHKYNSDSKFTLCLTFYFHFNQLMFNFRHAEKVN